MRIGWLFKKKMSNKMEHIYIHNLIMDMHKATNGRTCCPESMSSLNKKELKKYLKLREKSEKDIII